jgi:hypothetical protein
MMTFRGLSIGSSFTLLTTLFTGQILAFSVLFLVFVLLSGLTVSLFFIEFNMLSKLERIENYCNYLQIKIKEQKKDLNKDFIPLSFAFPYLKRDLKNLKQAKQKYRCARKRFYLKKPPIPIHSTI